MGVSSDRIHRIKAKVVAQFKAAHPDRPDGGINSFPPSTLLLQRQGTLNVVKYDYYKDAIRVDAGCAGCPVPELVESGVACGYMPVNDYPAKRRYSH